MIYFFKIIQICVERNKMWKNVILNEENYIKLNLNKAICLFWLQLKDVANLKKVLID